MSRRFTPLARLDATRFSDDRDPWNVEDFIREFKAQRQFSQPLIDKTTTDKNWGRKRGPGDWGLLYLAFVKSRDADIINRLDRINPQI